MINLNDIMETINMISEENLDIRTVTMGISLLDCADSDIDRACDKIYDKITRLAGIWLKWARILKKSTVFLLLIRGYRLHLFQCLRRFQAEIQ